MEHKWYNNDKTDLNKTLKLDVSQVVYIFVLMEYFQLGIQNNRECRHDHKQHILSCLCEANQLYVFALIISPLLLIYAQHDYTDTVSFARLYHKKKQVMLRIAGRMFHLLNTNIKAPGITLRPLLKM